MSKIRRVYFVKLVIRILIFIASILVFAFAPKQFNVMNGASFFSGISVFHLLWIVWVFDMITQLMPVKNIALGSQKLFKEKFRPAMHKLLDKDRLKDYIKKTNNAAGKVMALWATLLAFIGALKLFKVIDNRHILIISIAFYVCDLICVLIWCPFRLMLGNKCCTTCRIFNWDHFMMFSPMIFAGSFFGTSLFLLSLVDLIVWEIMIYLHPERFWENSNMALKCSECTDKLCTQYCQKLRKK